jgi:hypothetical protein
MGWDQYENGDLLRAGEDAGFDLMITGDGKLRYQQNLKLRTIAIIELTVNNWPSVRPHVAEILFAVSAATPGSYQVIDCMYIYTGRKKTPNSRAE